MLKVTPVPAFTDNYIWFIHQPSGDEVLVVDPGSPSPVIEALEKRNLQLAGLLITHSHQDHIGGINAMLQYKKVPIFGPECSAIPQVDNILHDNDSFHFWGYEFSVIHLPGHLPEHVAYVVTKGGDKAARRQIFSADILFSAGCGRIFNGTHSELKQSLDRLKGYPEDTMFYPAHEYTLANLRFAKAVEPKNDAINKRYEEVERLRNQNIPSLPTNLALELTINPFLRCDEKAVINAVRDRLGREPNDENEVFKTLRLWKDSF